MNRVVYHLATAPGNVKQRLIEAHRDFVPLSSNEFPVEYRAEFEKIISDLTEKGEKLDPTGVKQILTPVENTLKNKHLETLSRIAVRIFNLNNKIQDC